MTVAKHGALPDTLNLAARCLRIDARRPASWLGLVCAAVATWWLTREAAAGRGTTALTGLGLLGGTAAALASAGELLAGPLLRTTPQLLRASTGSRLVWPCTGAALAAVWFEPPAALVVSVAGGAVAAGLTNLVLCRQGADAAEAGGATLVAAAAAGSAGLVTTSTAGIADGPWLGLAVAVAVWAGVLIATVRWLAAEHRAAPWSPTDTIEAIGWPAASGRLGSGLFAAGMIAALLGMAGWLFLMPERWTWYRGLAAIWFVVLALPRTTLAWGAAGASGRRRILATTARPTSGTGGLVSWLEGASGVGPLGPEWRVPLATAAILGWPPLVAAGVVGGAEAVERIHVVTALVSWAVALALVTALILCCGGGRETAQAVAMIIAVAWFAAVAHLEQPQRPRNDGRNGVEESGASCETPRQ